MIKSQDVKVGVLFIGLAIISGCTLSTTGLRPPGNHQLVYPKPEPTPAPPPVTAPKQCKPPALGGAAADLSGCKPGDKVILGGLNFGSNEAVLSPVGKQLLDQVAVALSAAPGITIDILGHTDNIGETDYNQALSTQRALSVMQYLVASGISPTRMSIKGFGESSPLADNLSAEGRSLNRRVELLVVRGGMVMGMLSPAVMPPAAAPSAVGASTGATVSIEDNAFVPATLTVAAGATVTWTNTGGSNHIVKFSAEKSPRLRTDAQFSKSFTETGEYEYECGIHGKMMTGKIIVTG